MKQTAVEWLVEKLENHNGVTRAGFEKCIQDAKGMEKEQMKYFIQVGYYAHSQGHKKDEELYNYWINNYNRE
jgi:spore coat protein CotF